ncbi:ankyrin repeat and LEM domain-containing protein 1 [Heptranchias perlo]|uniref:ankyrin repeat and LEM domain-containing protein 1 n=1 Tax=Heptranchias perlo TaxID=212740 RepID=UPI0035595AD4
MWIACPGRQSVERCLKEPVDPNLVLPEGTAALHLASGKDTEGGIRCLKRLLQYGANPNVRSTEDLTPLHVAASWGCLKSVKLLLRSGADPTLVDQDGLRAVDLAEEQGNEKCCQILQEYHRYSLLEATEEELPAYRYVCYRRWSNDLHFFADPAELGYVESRRTSRLPGTSEEFHPASRTLRFPTHEQLELGVTPASEISQPPSCYSTKINPRADPLEETTAVWPQSSRPQSRSGTIQPQRPHHHSGIAEDWGEDQIVGATTEPVVGNCVLSSIRVSTFGKFEEQASNGLNSTTDSSEDHTSTDQELTLQDDKSFLPVSAPLLPPAVSHGLHTSIDDESFLPPSASQLYLAGKYELNTSTNHLPETQYFPVEHDHAQRETIAVCEENEAFADGDASVGTEWLSELDCTCTLKGRSLSSVSLSNTMLDLAKYEGFCDSEFLIRSSRNKGIDITSPDHVYVFECANLSALPDLDKTTPVLFEDSLDRTMEADDEGSPLNVDNNAQRERGDPKASASNSSSSSNPYRSCESGSEVFSSAIESFGHTSHAQPVQDDPISQTDNDSCLAQQIPSGRNQDDPNLGCKSEIATAAFQPESSKTLPGYNAANVSQEILDSIQTSSFKDSQLIEKTASNSPLPRDGDWPKCNSPSPQTQPICRDAGLLYDALADPSDNDVPQSLCAGPTCANGCMSEEELTMVLSSMILSTQKHHSMLNSENESSPAMNTDNQNHKWQRGEQPIAEPDSFTGRIENGDFPGLLMLPAKKSSLSIVQADEPSLGTLHRGSASINNSAGNQTQGHLDEEYSSIEDEGGSSFKKLLNNTKLATKTGQSLQSNENGLSPFVTPRTKSRLANSMSRSQDSSLFEQTMAMPTRIRRIRNPQIEYIKSPPGWCSSHNNGATVSQDEDQTPSLVHSSDFEDPDFDTVPFVKPSDNDKCGAHPSPASWQDHEDPDFDTVPFVKRNDHEKWSPQPLPASCQDADFDTVPFFNTTHEKRTFRPPPRTCDTNGNNQSVRLKSVTDANKGSQTVPFPHHINPEETGDANQDGCLCPPIRQAGTEVAQHDVKAKDVDQRRSCNFLEDDENCQSDTTWISEDHDLRDELKILKIEQGLYSVAKSPGVHSRPSSPCLISGDPEAEGKDCLRSSNVCESTRLEDTNPQLGNCSKVRSQDHRCSYSKRSVERRLSKIPNCNAEWQSLLGNLDLPLSPGGRPVNSSGCEPVEYLYTDTEDGLALIERRYPCKDATFENLSTSSSEETIIYDWKAYKSRQVRAEEKEDPLSSDGSPQLSPRLLLLSNGQIRRQLRDYGENPGPVTALTRKVYLQCLDRIRKEPHPRKPQQSANYSPELCQSLDKFVFPDCSQDEMALAQQFDQPDQNRRWREGLLKSSFNYLLLDPRVTKNLPARCHSLSPAECFRTFVSSIFYVGKGKRSRPYCHLYEALTHCKNGNEQVRGNSVSVKLKHILDIWESGQGVISLHCFQNVIPVEAYTREACMVDALGLQMLTNKKRGDYYGVAATWPMKQRRWLGAHMLRRAMQIFLAEGERQLRPADIKLGQ